MTRGELVGWLIVLALAILCFGVVLYAAHQYLNNPERGVHPLDGDDGIGSVDHLDATLRLPGAHKPRGPHGDSSDSGSDSDSGSGGGPGLGAGR